MAVVIIALVIIIFALLVITGFSYLVLKTLEKIFTDYEAVNTSNQTLPTTDQFTPDFAPGQVPIEQFTPDPTKPLKLKFTDDVGEGIHGVEEVEE